MDLDKIGIPMATQHDKVAHDATVGSNSLSETSSKQQSLLCDEDFSQKY